MAAVQITTIKPTAGLFASFAPRTPEGQEKKPEVFLPLTEVFPALISNIANDEIRAFATRAWLHAAELALRAAVKENSDAVNVPSLAEAFAPKEGKEYLITKKDLLEWLEAYAMPLIEGAIAAKAGRPVTDVKVVKKALSYKETFLGICSRSILKQADIDSIIRTLQMLDGTGKQHPYSENVTKAIVRKQDQLDKFLAEGEEEGEDVDF